MTVCVTTYARGFPVTSHSAGATGGRTPAHNAECWYPKESCHTSGVPRRP